MPVRRSVSDTLPVKTARRASSRRSTPAREPSNPHRGAECPLEGLPQHGIRLGHRHREPEIHEAGDAVLPNTTRDDAGEMREIRLNVEANAVICHPAADPNPDRGDLVLRSDS